jgi:hypothetical protein
MWPPSSLIFLLPPICVPPFSALFKSLLPAFPIHPSYFHLISIPLPFKLDVLKHTKEWSKRGKGGEDKEPPLHPNSGADFLRAFALLHQYQTMDALIGCPNIQKGQGRGHSILSARLVDFLGMDGKSWILG